MSEAPELRLTIPAPNPAPTPAHPAPVPAGPLLTVAIPARRAAAAPPPAPLRTQLDVSAVSATRRQPVLTPYGGPAQQLNFVARPAGGLLPPVAGPVLTVSIVDGPGEEPGRGPAVTSSRLPVVASAAAGVVLVLVAAGVATRLVPADLTAAPGPGAHPTTAATAPSPRITRSAPPSASPSPPPSPSPSPSPSVAGRPEVPDLALGMTTAAALDELELQSRDGAPAIAGLAGAWVPQVSFKCPGLRVDLGPGWIPDGADDTAHVTVQQILAFHLSLHARLGAQTVHPTQLGMTADRGTSGACAGQTIWMSVIPQGFSSAQAAKNWCDTNGLPARECSARYVARPGERSVQVDRT